MQWESYVVSYSFECALILFKIGNKTLLPTQWIKLVAKNFGKWHHIILVH